MSEQPPRLPEPLLARIVEVWHPVAVWLFGSRARGDARPTSDWDVAVVVPDDAPDALLDPVAAYQAIRHLKLRVDILPVRRSDFEEGARLFGSLAQIISEEGAQVYAA